MEKVRIYSSDEGRIKILGEVFGNDSSRLILLSLARTEMTVSEIAAGTGLSMPLVTHHMKKMQKAGIVNVSRVAKNSRNHDMKYYRAAPAILIFPKEAYDKAMQSKPLASSLRRIMKFAAIGVAGMASWMVAEYSSSAGIAGQSAQDSMQNAEPFAPVLVRDGRRIIGLIADRFNSLRSKKIIFPRCRHHINIWNNHG